MREIVKTDKYGSTRHQLPDDAEIVAESARALLIRRPVPKKRRWHRQEYRTVCLCPYLCLATYEQCEFDGND